MDTNKPLKRNRKKQIHPEAIQAGLTDKELQFCQLYTNSNEYRGNGVQAYGKAFGLNLAQPGKYNIAKTNASKLLTRIEILNQIQQIFENDGMNETTVQNEHSFLMKQNSDFGSKLGAVRLWYELQGRLRKVDQANAYQFNITIDGRDKPIEITPIDE